MRRRGLPGRFVDLPLHRDARNHIPEFHPSGSFGQDRDVVRIPLDKGVPLLHRSTVGDGNNRTDHDIVALEFAPILRMDRNRAVLIQNDEIAVHGLNNPEIVEMDVSVVLRLDNRLLKELGSSSTDVECTHCELGTRLTDALGGDNPDRFTEFHHPPRGQIPPVTLGTNPTLRFAGEN